MAIPDVLKPSLLVLTVLVCASLSMNCHEDTAKVEMVKNAKEILEIRPSPTMPKEIAEKIMWFYFLQNISGCGFPCEPVDEGEYWTSIPRVGDAGQADKDTIRLHKRSGRISWGRGPAFDSLKAMVRGAKP